MKFLQPIEIPVDGSTTLWCISHSPQFCGICTVVEATLCPIIDIINEDAGTGLSTDPWSTTTSYWSPNRPFSTHQHPLSSAIQTIFSPPHCLLIQHILHELLHEVLMRGSVENLTEAKVDNIHFSTLIYQTVSSQKVISLVKHVFPLLNLC